MAQATSGTARRFMQDSLGNTIQNRQNISVNGQLNFVNLYNKIKYLKKINDKAKGAKRTTGQQEPTRRTPGGRQDGKAARRTSSKIDPLEGFLRVLMIVRNGTITYSQNSGILLPGYSRTTNIIGMDDFDAPGWGFVLGRAEPQLQRRHHARLRHLRRPSKDWLVQTPSIFNPYTNTRTENDQRAPDAGALQEHAHRADGQPHLSARTAAASSAGTTH